jgi:class 3 adenylate cyclase
VDPEIRYTTTSDGLSLAYWTMGAGEPLLITSPLGYSHIQLELQFPPLREWYERLAQSRTVVRFDWRAQGLSQRNVPPPPEYWDVLDLVAVVSAIDTPQIDLLCCGAGGFGGVMFASRYADRVRKLVLWTVPADGGTWGSPQVKVATTLVDKDYRIFTETLAGAILNWDDPAAAHAWAQFMRRAMNERDHQTMFADSRVEVHPPSEEEVRTALRAITASTLILHPDRFRNMPVENAERLASSIADSRLTITSGGGGMPIDSQPTAAIEAFLGIAKAATKPSPAAPSAHMVVILFTDIVDSTALTERMGDAAFRAKSRELDESLRSIIRECGGTVIDAKTLGDGVLATFPAASQAIDAALRCGEAGGRAGLPLHLGLHAGDVIREEGNVFGGAVNIAARISGMSAAGELLVSDIVRGLARTSASVTFEDRGEQSLKGVGEPVRVFAVKRDG